MDPEVIKILIEIFGPAAVTLILLIVAINKLWPQVVQDQEQTRNANRELTEAIGNIVIQHSQAISALVKAIQDTEERLSRQHARFERILDRKEEQSHNRYEEYMGAFAEVSRSLDAIAERLENGN